MTFSVSESGLLVGGGDVGVESLVDPVALAEEVGLSPSTRNWAELSMPRQCAQQRPGLGTPRRLGAVQHVDGVVGDHHQAILDPENCEASEVGDEEEGEVWRRLADERLADLAASRKESRRIHDQVLPQ